MNRDRRRLGDYLEHVLEAIDRIQRYVAGMDERAFEQNGMAQDAVIRNFEIIGEASHNIETHFPEFAAAHPDLPLAYAYQMRNAVAHGSRAGDDSVSSFRRRPESSADVIDAMTAVLDTGLCRYDEAKPMDPGLRWGDEGAPG